MRIVYRSAIMQCADFFHRYESTRDHAIEDGEEALNFLLAVDDFNDHRQVHRKPENLRSMHPAGFAETNRPTQSCGASQMHLARFENDRFVKRSMLIAIAFADED